MMDYQIFTDSCCDFPQHMYKDLDLTMVPLSVDFRGKVCQDYTEEWLKDLFAGLRAGEQAKTAAVNPENWEQAMEPVLKAGKDILVIAFSSGLSGTYQAAVIAANDMQENTPTERSGLWIPWVPPWA